MVLGLEQTCAYYIFRFGMRCGESVTAVRRILPEQDDMLSGARLLQKALGGTIQQETEAN